MTSRNQLLLFAGVVLGEILQRDGFDLLGGRRLGIDAEVPDQPRAGAGLQLRLNLRPDSSWQPTSRRSQPSFSKQRLDVFGHGLEVLHGLVLLAPLDVAAVVAVPAFALAAAGQLIHKVLLLGDRRCP